MIRDEAARRGTLQALADAAGLSIRTIERLAQGEPHGYHAHTISCLEMAMRWQPGSVQRVLEGQPPMMLDDPQLEWLTDVWPKLSRRDRMIVLAVIEALMR